jgi:hypothetical protein
VQVPRLVEMITVASGRVSHGDHEWIGRELPLGWRGSSGYVGQNATEMAGYGPGHSGRADCQVRVDIKPYAEGIEFGPRLR